VALETFPGLIIRAQSGFFTVQTEMGVFTCQLRGRLKQGRRVGDIAAVGDRVSISLVNTNTGMIEDIEPRTKALVRLDPRPQGIYQQVILANPDQAVFVFACSHPEPHLRMLDRFLVIAEKQGVPALIVANKVDLVEPDFARNLFGHYPALGYPVIYSSVKQELGLDELHERLKRKITCLAGPSGVGKSSLLNAIQPGLGQAVREVSVTMNKGKHTTVVRELFPLAGGGYVADTPGMRSLALWDTYPEELDGYFPELASRIDGCQFNDCSHTHEPGCAILAAVETGEVNRARYESYLRLRDGEE
jgi:ribosome biogenesis GTPase / thiamine phosphate phosphatase